jgi:Nif-specific regulatory protein
MVQVQRMGSLKDKLEDMEREAILIALEECDWVMAKAARLLGITERMIGYKIRKYNIQKEATQQKNTKN